MTAHSTASGDYCSFLSWDSEFFGVRIARCDVRQLTPDTIAPILEWCESEAIDCLYFIAAQDDQTTIQLAAENNFLLVDIRMTFEKACGSNPPADKADLPVRPAQEEDIPILQGIAASSYRDSRYYFDPNFPDAICDKFYATWIEKSCRGYEDIVLVSHLDGRAAGFISCSIIEPGRGQIGLVGVGPEYRGRGQGQVLLQAAQRWFQDQGAERIFVVTQGRNIAAQRLYQRAGYVTHSMELYYHRWFRT